MHQPAPIRRHGWKRDPDLRLLSRLQPQPLRRDIDGHPRPPGLYLETIRITDAGGPHFREQKRHRTLSRLVGPLVNNPQGQQWIVRSGSFPRPNRCGAKQEATHRQHDPALHHGFVKATQAHSTTPTANPARAGQPMHPDAVGNPAASPGFGHGSGG